MAEGSSQKVIQNTPFPDPEMIDLFGLASPGPAWIPKIKFRRNLSKGCGCFLFHEMSLELVSRFDFWCNRHCRTNPIDLEGSRSQVSGVCDGFGMVFGWSFEGVWLLPGVLLTSGHRAPRTHRLSLGVSHLPTEDGSPRPRMSPNPINLYGLGPWFIRFGDIHGPKPVKFIRIGDIYGPKPFKLYGLVTHMAPNAQVGAEACLGQARC
jgi:hypothetical protein